MKKSKAETFIMLEQDDMTQDLLSAASLAVTMWLVSLSIVCIGVLCYLAVMFPNHPFNTGPHVDFMSWVMGLK